ncbi:MAG: hypothetical protein A2008_10015 [Candidatus Wallbacteria bacterium GWC2_49_35]|uniref:DUF5667 domain-containing protein n=1 Tax=Candidatus Wallbacteria bacterium GWC2_49_35 TaxID=1817813 RepID=A0A1F7WLD7_9BACT|nr:MAG: hypothetical protein A2008_10015 [Candidatus Wallbacteria bacterium GWC2_49_35]HBC74920.1 hypothetical protein [Candidatus Wallbacteria bacterium]
MKTIIARFIMVTMFCCLCLIFLAVPGGPCLAVDSEKDSTAGDPEEAAVATVDIATVYALHPAMIYFDPVLNLFIKPAPKGVTPDDFMKLTTERRDEYKKSEAARAAEIQRVKNEIDSVKEEIKAHEIKKITECAPVNEKFDPLIQNATSEAEVKKYLVERTAALKGVEVKYDLEIKNKNKKLSDALDKYQKIQMSLLSSFYLTAEETAAKFEEINADIKDAVKIAAKKNKAIAVVNFNLDNYKDRNKTSGEDTQSLEAKEKVNSELESLLKQGPDYSPLLDSLKTYEAGASAKAGQALKRRFALTPNESDMASRPFIAKGKDLTWFTVITLMVKNGVPKEKAEAISEVLAEVYGRPAGSE